MKKRGDSRKFLTVALALGVLANAGGKLAFADDTEAVKYSPITQLPNQFAVYGACMASHGQRFG